MSHLVKCVVCDVQFETRTCTTKTCSAECRSARVLLRVHKCKKQDRSALRQHPSQITPDYPGESWCPVSEFEHYFVSNYGRVCSVDRVVPYEGEIRKRDSVLRRGQLLKPGTLPSGHRYVVFYGGHHRQVHRLLLTAFVGPCPEGEEALHGDDNAGHNWLTNLRWGTRGDNIRDGIRNGKVPIGVDKPQAKLNDDAVRYIRANLHIGDYNLAKLFNVSGAAVKQVRDGITWKHVA